MEQLVVFILSIVTSLMIGLFHYIILGGFYKLKLNKYFFLIYPSLISLAYFIDNSLRYYLFMILMDSTFILFVIGIVIMIISPLFKNDKENRVEFRKKLIEKTKKRHHKKATLDAFRVNDIQLPSIKESIPYPYILFTLCLLLTLYWDVYAFIIFFISSIFILIIFNLLSPRGNILFNLQRKLPTSKIGSAAIGIAEIKGKIVIDKPMDSRIGSRKCAGYLYLVQEKSSNNSDQYNTIHEDFAYYPFYLEDETGKIKVIPNNISLLNFKEKKRNIKGGYIEKEYILEEDGKDYLMIGKVSNINGETILEYDEHRQILSISPIEEIEEHNKYLYEYKKTLPYIVITLLWIVFILSSEVGISREEGISIIPFHYLYNFFNF